MGDKSRIEWLADRDGRPGATWNPVRGCTRVSEGCRFCYAERQAARFAGPGAPYHGLVRTTPSGPRWTGKVVLVEKHLEDPLRWRRPRRIFVNSMSDLFHEGLSDAALDRIFGVMMRANRHDYQILTKRVARMREYAASRFPGATFAGSVPAGAPAQAPSHLWMGVSIEDQKTFDDRIGDLLETPAELRWVSFEPLLGAVRLHGLGSKGSTGIQWAVIGGESGPEARRMEERWALDLREALEELGVSVFVKQMGSAWARRRGETGKGNDPAAWPARLRIRNYPTPEERMIRTSNA